MDFIKCVFTGAFLANSTVGIRVLFFMTIYNNNLKQIMFSENVVNCTHCGLSSIFTWLSVLTILQLFITIAPRVLRFVEKND